MMKKALKKFMEQAKRQGPGRRRQRGMTLVEIMVVITIIGLITAAVAVAVMPQLGRARVDRAKSDIKSIESALDLYKMKKGSYPDTAAGLNAVVQSGDLKELPMDPWNQPYMYMLEGGRPVIVTYGADGQAGGEDENADISNRSSGRAQQ